MQLRAQVSWLQACCQHKLVLQLINLRSVLRTEGGRRPLKTTLVTGLLLKFSNRQQVPGNRPLLYFLSGLAQGTGTKHSASTGPMLLGGPLPGTLRPPHIRTTALTSVLWPFSPVFQAMWRIQDPPSLESPTHHSSPWQPSTATGSTDSGKELGFTPKHSPQARRGLGPLGLSLSIKCFPTLGIFPWSNSLHKGK